MSLRASSPHARSMFSVRTADSSIYDEEIKSGRAWAKQMSDPWDPLILTLDGGGIRGYSSLLILERLMREVAVWENRFEEQEADLDVPDRTFDEKTLLPCHYFDYMYGTSTGGLIATMLGRLRMSVPQCLEIYKRIGNDLFGHKRSMLPLTTKYHHRPLEEAVKGIVRRHCKEHLDACEGDDWHPWRVAEDGGEEMEGISSEPYPRDRICQSICLTAVHNGKLDEAFLLRSYNHVYDMSRVPNWITLYNEGAVKMRIWEVTRATSAAPFYFDMLEADIKGEIMGFKDGGIRENNPAGAAWSEFVSLYGDRDPALLLSIGTGRKDTSQDGFAAAWPGPLGSNPLMKKAAEKFAVFKNVLIKYTEGEEKHKAMKLVARGEHRWYKRLNVSTGLETMKLDSWEPETVKDPKTGAAHVVPGGKSLKRMEDATETYLTRPLDKKFDTYAPPIEMIIQCAEILVRHRRAREKGAANKHSTDEDKERWDTFMGKYLTGVKLDAIDGVVDHER